MTCREVRRLLPLFVGGDLEARRMREVADHVARCADCATEIAQFRAVRELLSLASPRFDTSERALVRRRVLDEITRTNGVRSPVHGLTPWPARVILAAAVVLAASLLSPFLVRDVRDETNLVQAHPSPLPSAAPTPVPERMAESAPRAPAVPRGTMGKRMPVSRIQAVERSAAPVRFELQTGNVNVRIIWFGGGSAASKENS